MAVLSSAVIGVATRVPDRVRGRGARGAAARADRQGGRVPGEGGRRDGRAAGARDRRAPARRSSCSTLSVADPFLVLAAFVLGAIGLAAVGSLFGVVAESARTREAIFLMLVLPLVAPVSIAGARDRLSRRRVGRARCGRGSGCSPRSTSCSCRLASWCSATCWRSDGGDGGTRARQGEPRSGEHLLGIVALVALGVSAVLSLVVAPPDAVQGEVQRIMYVHVPAAWLALPLLLLRRVHREHRLPEDEENPVGPRRGRLGRDRRPVHVARDRAGMLWGKPVWGTWWTWDPRSHHHGRAAHDLRRVPRDPPDHGQPSRRARWAALIGIVGFIDVPIVHLSVVWWRSLHQGPTLFRLGAPEIEGTMAARAPRRGGGVSRSRTPTS